MESLMNSPMLLTFGYKDNNVKVISLDGEAEYFVIVAGVLKEPEVVLTFFPQWKVLSSLGHKKVGPANLET